MTLVGELLSKYPSVSALDSRFFNSSNDFCRPGLHTNGSPFFVSWRRGADTVAKSGTNRAVKLTRPRKLHTSAAFVASWASTTAFTFTSAGPIPRADKAWPMTHTCRGSASNPCCSILGPHSQIFCHALPQWLHVLSHHQEYYELDQTLAGLGEVPSGTSQVHNVYRTWVVCTGRAPCVCQM